MLINHLALSLDEDVYGAGAKFNDQQIRDRLMQSIVEQCNYSMPDHIGIGEYLNLMSAEHKHKPAVTLWQAANLILGVWRHMDCRLKEALMEANATPEAMPRPRKV
jgi:hypothetical protein